MSEHGAPALPTGLMDAERFAAAPTTTVTATPLPKDAVAAAASASAVAAAATAAVMVTAPEAVTKKRKNDTLSAIVTDVEQPTTSHARKKSRQDIINSSPNKKITVEDCNKTWLSPKELAALEAQGMSFNKGKWSAEEVLLLRNNVEKYCQQHSISDIALLLFHINGQENIKRQRKDEFYKTVSDGLNRPLFAVYRKILREYDPTNNKGQYTPEEDEELKRLHAIHGNDWQAIGSQMTRSYTSVKDRSRRITSSGKGEWSVPEEEKLVSAIKIQLGLDQTEDIPHIELSNVSWKAVAEVVVSRDAHRCRHKWMHSVGPRLLSPKQWDENLDIELINKLLALGFQKEFQIRWADVSRQFAQQIRGVVIKKSFDLLKRRFCKGKEKSFQNLPMMLAYMKGMMESTPGSVTSGQPAQVEPPVGHASHAGDVVAAAAAAAAAAVANHQPPHVMAPPSQLVEAAPPALLPHAMH